MRAARAGAGRPGPREEYAGIVSRLAALTVDAVLLAAAGLAVGLGAPALWSAVVGSAPHEVHAVADVVAGLLPLVYFWTSWWVRGQTVGGLLIGTAVRRKDGSPIGLSRAGLRAFVGLLFAPVWLVGMVTTVVDRRRRGLLDLAMGTVVVRVEDPGEGASV